MKSNIKKFSHLGSKKKARKQAFLERETLRNSRSRSSNVMNCDNLQEALKNLNYEEGHLV